MTRATRTALVAGTLALLGAALPTAANQPTLGGPMVHLEVSFDGATLSVHKGSPDTLVLRSYPGVAYDPPADVLNDTMYNGQYGWMIMGTWTAPPGASLWIESLDATPGMNVYAARNAPSPYAPIFGTDGSPLSIRWSGMMTHNWYSTTINGRYTARYRVYFGDDTGAPMPGYGAAEVRLDWTTGLPCPSDFDGSGDVAVSDIFAFLAAWFAGDARADLGDAPGNDVADIFRFLTLWFGGCA